MMKITFTGIFVWKGSTGAIKENTTNSDVDVYTIWYNNNGMPVITNITTDCEVSLTATDSTSGIFTVKAEWNPTSISVDEVFVVVRSTAVLTDHVHLQTQFPRDFRDHMIIRLR